MNDLKTIYIKEWSRLKADHLKNSYEISQLRESDFKFLSELGNKIEITQLAKGIEIESRSYVGAIKFKDFQLIIEPKISNLSLAKMIAFAYDLNNIHIFEDSVGLSNQRANISDLIALIFLNKAEKIFYQGLRKRYQEKEENIASCRGKINFNKLAKNSSASLTLPCRFQELTVDIEENQIILSTLELLILNINNQNLKKRIIELFSKLNDKITLKNLNKELLEQANNNIDRLNNDYNDIFKIVELLLTKNDFNLIGNQNNDFSEFLLDMNLLFEKFLYKYFKKKLNSNLRVRYQRSLKNKFKINAGNIYSLIPDYQFYMNDKLFKIADTKYKDYQNKKVSAADLYQLTVYAFANQEKIDQVYLFYPASTMMADNYYLKNRYRDAEINIIAKGLNLDTLIANIEYDNFVTEIFK
jgi:5-methylcytosine-specific restriction enzyme subunit McrC